MRLFWILRKEKSSVYIFVTGFFYLFPNSKESVHQVRRLFISSSPQTRINYFDVNGHPFVEKGYLNLLSQKSYILAHSIERKLSNSRVHLPKP